MQYSHTHTDEELIKGCLTNDKKMQYALYTRYYSLLYHICMRYCKTVEDTEDALSIVFIKIFRCLDTFRFKGSFEGWLRRIAVSESLNYLRTIKKYQMNVDIDDPLIYAEANDMISHDSDVISKMNEREIMNIIDTLPPGYQEVFKLYVIEQYKHDEIAKLLNISINTSKSQLIKARKWLQMKISRY